MMFLQMFVAALLGSSLGIFVAAVAAYRYNKKWEENHKD